MKAKENKKRRFCFSISDTEEFYSMFNRGASRFNFFFLRITLAVVMKINKDIPTSALLTFQVR